MNNFEKDFLKILSAATPLKEPRIDRIHRISNLAMRHAPGLSVFDGATHPAATDICLGSQCDTPRTSCTPLREGMARQRFIDNQNDAAAHPLSERGGRRPGCVAPSNTDNPGCVALSNWLSVNSGQSVVSILTQWQIYSFDSGLVLICVLWRLFLFICLSLQCD